MDWFYIGLHVHEQCAIPLNILKKTNSPNIVSLAVRFSVFNKAGTVFVQELMALGALKACSVPLEVRSYPQDVLVVDLRPAPHAHAQSSFLWNRTT